MSLDAQTIVDTVASADEATALSIIQAILSNRPELAPLLVNFAVPELTYPPSKAMTSGREKGVIKSLSREKGFGFIDCAELKEVFQGDVFLHIKQAQEYAVGQPVTFAVMLNKDNRPQAYDLIADLEVMKGKGKGDLWSSSAPPAPPPVLQASAPPPPPAPVVHVGADAWNACSKGGWSAGDAWSGEAWAPAGDSWSGEGAKGMMMNMNMMSAFGDGYGDAWKGKGKGKGFGGFEGGKDCGKGKKGKFAEGKAEREEDLGQMQGRIKAFDAESGYGYIECQDLKDVGCPDDALLLQAHKGDFEVGAYVEFTCIMKGGKPQAKDLVAVPPEKIPRA